MYHRSCNILSHEEPCHSAIRKDHDVSQEIEVIQKTGFKGENGGRRDMELHFPWGTVVAHVDGKINMNLKQKNSIWVSQNVSFWLKMLKLNIWMLLNTFFWETFRFVKSFWLFILMPDKNKCQNTRTSLQGGNSGFWSALLWDFSPLLWFCQVSETWYWTTGPLVWSV